MSSNTKKVGIYFPADLVSILDRECLNANEKSGGAHISRTALVVEILTHADIPRAASRLAKVTK